MSADRVALVRRFYEAWNQYGPQVLARQEPPTSSSRTPPRCPTRLVRRGRDAVRERLEEVASTVGGGWVEVRELREFDDTVLVRMEWKLGDRVRGAPVGDVFHLVGVTDGEIVSIRVFLRESDAIEAAEGF